MSMARSCAGSAVFFALVASADAACLPPSGNAVAFVPAPRDLQMESGQAVRLSGVAPGLAVGFRGPAQLYITDPRPDRWGRVAALVQPNDVAGDTLNLAQVRQGHSLAITTDLPADCVPLFLAAESEARAARRGIWAQTASILAADDVAPLRQREGLYTLVRGRVLSVRQGRQRVYLNFGAFGSERFSVFVAVARLRGIQAAGLDLIALKGQEIEVRGTIGPGLTMELTTPLALVKLRRS